MSVTTHKTVLLFWPYWNIVIVAIISNILCLPELLDIVITY